MKQRPKHLNLLVIKLPIPGIVSILHRASGAYLIWALPLLVWALAIAVNSSSGYEKIITIFDHQLIKLLLLGVIWSCMHHLCAGIRFLLIEMLVGIELQTTRMLTYVVLVVSLILTAILGYYYLYS